MNSQQIYEIKDIQDIINEYSNSIKDFNNHKNKMKNTFKAINSLEIFQSYTVLGRWEQLDCTYYLNTSVARFTQPTEFSTEYTLRKRIISKRHFPY